MLFAVEDVGLGNIVVTLFHQDHLHDVLNLLHRGDGVSAEFVCQHKGYDIGNRPGCAVIHEPVRFHGFVHGCSDLILNKISNAAVSFFDS